MLCICLMAGEPVLRLYVMCVAKLLSDPEHLQSKTAVGCKYITREIYGKKCVTRTASNKHSVLMEITLCMTITTAKRC